MSSTTTSPETRSIDGHPTAWQRWMPDGPCHGALFFLHGQGDYCERYRDVAKLFTDAGIAFLTCDLPGHGSSPGKRGHIPSFSLVEKIAARGLADARELASQPGQLVGLCGHSVGGLLTLSILQRLAEADAPDFSWVSSPLLVADAQQPAWKRSLLRPLARTCPTLTVSTGVTAALCRVDSPSEPPAPAPSPSQFHSRISLSWGSRLIDLADELRAHPERIPSQTTLLMTQGGNDRICPPNYWHDFVKGLPQERLTTQFFPDSRHEPFADETREQTFASIRQWIQGLLPEKATTDTPEEN